MEGALSTWSLGASPGRERPLGYPRDSSTSATLLVLCAFALGQAVHAYNGALSPEAFAWLNGAVAAGVLALVTPAFPWLERRGRACVVTVGAAALAHQFAGLFGKPLTVYAVFARLETISPEQLLPYAAVLSGLALTDRPRWRGVFLPLVIVPHLLVGYLVIRASPAPHIDVFYFQRDSSAAILAGHNPYTLTFPNIYGDSSAFYGPNMSVGGRLLFGYPYPPLSLLFSTFGHLLGDFRYAQLFAIEGAALCMLYARGDVFGKVAALLYLFTPRSFFVLEQGWTEPYVVLLLAVTVLVACRSPRALPFALGGFLAVKQYLVLAVLPALLLIRRGTSPRGALRLALLAAATSLALTLPLALWSFRAFYWDVVALQVHQPFRPDALSYLAWWFQRTGAAPPTALAFVAALLVSVAALIRFPRTPSGFAAALSLVLLAFFAFNKQAFCNYYYCVIGALCTSVAATRT